MVDKEGNTLKFSGVSTSAKGGAPPKLPSWAPPDTTAAAATTTTAASTASSLAESMQFIDRCIGKELPEYVYLDDKNTRAFYIRLHAKYLLSLGLDSFSKESFYAVSLKMGAAYWASTALWLLGLRRGNSFGEILQNENAGNFAKCGGVGFPRKLECKTNGAMRACNSACNRCCEHGRCRCSSSSSISSGSSNSSSCCTNTGNSNSNGNSSSNNSSSSVSSAAGESASIECRDKLTLDYLLDHRELSLLEYIKSCLSRGGFSYDVNQDEHIASTNYALLLLAGMKSMNMGSNNILLDELNGVELKERIRACTMRLKQRNGGFQGDIWGEVDSRYVYCGVSTLCMLGDLDDDTSNESVYFIQHLMNEDGGFGWIPGGESHAASAFCCIATLALCGGLWVVDRSKTSKWLIARQTNIGGFNGRPEKAPDVCYSFWVYASLRIIGYQESIDISALQQFILDSQDMTTGGFADRPDNVSDVFHTFFAIATLGMIQHHRSAEGCNCSSNCNCCSHANCRSNDTAFASCNATRHNRSMHSNDNNNIYNDINDGKHNDNNNKHNNANNDEHDDNISKHDRKNNSAYKDNNKYINNNKYDEKDGVYRMCGRALLYDIHPAIALPFDLTENLRTHHSVLQ